MNHKNELTDAQAIARKEWTDNWESLRVWAMRCTIRYCRTRLAQYSEPQWEDVRDEALNEAWRTITNDPSVTARQAISRAVDNITYELSRHNETRCQNDALGEMPAHTEQYESSQDQIAELLNHLPKSLRPIVTLLSAGITETQDLMEYLNCTDRNLRYQKTKLRKLLGSRFRYLLGDEMETSMRSRVG